MRTGAILCIVWMRTWMRQGRSQLRFDARRQIALMEDKLYKKAEKTEETKRSS